MGITTDTILEEREYLLDAIQATEYAYTNERRWKAEDGRPDVRDFASVRDYNQAHDVYAEKVSKEIDKDKLYCEGCRATTPTLTDENESIRCRWCGQEILTIPF